MVTLRSVSLRKDGQMKEAARGDSEWTVSCRKVPPKSEHWGARRGAGSHDGRGDCADQG